MYTIDEKHATTKEKNAFDELFREGKAVDSDINLGIYKKSKTGKEKIIIADSGA